MKLRFMYVSLLLITIICSSTIPNYRYNTKDYSEDDNIILWSNGRKLTWEDFKGVPDTSHRHSVLVTVAATTSFVNLEYSATNSKITSYKIESIFVKNKSWTMTDNNQVLAHEQLHFDITELYARRIRKAFDSLKLDLSDMC